MENRAERKGGSLRYVNKNFTFIEVRKVNTERGRRLQKTKAAPNVFTDNEATYGADLASFPASIELSGLDLDGGNMHVASGQAFDLYVYIKDSEGRVYNDE